MITLHKNTAAKVWLAAHPDGAQDDLEQFNWYFKLWQMQNCREKKVKQFKVLEKYVHTSFSESHKKYFVSLFISIRRYDVALCGHLNNLYSYYCI